VYARQLVLVHFPKTFLWRLRQCLSWHKEFLKKML
jgi:hypothetical protein